jgi:aspartate oxidase
MGVDLITTSKLAAPIAASRALDEKRRVGTIVARATILATGGAGRCLTSNPDVATGDGVAMAPPRRRRAHGQGILQFPVVL